MPSSGFVGVENGCLVQHFHLQESVLLHQPEDLGQRPAGGGVAEDKVAMALVGAGLEVAVELADALREKGFGVTEFSGQGREGPVEVVYTVARRAQVREIFRVVDVWDPDAFVTVEEPRAIHRGWMFDRKKK